MTAAHPCPASDPLLTGVPHEDAELLSQHTVAAQKMLACLPAKAQRTTDQQRAAELAHSACRRIRAGFMSMHGEWLYSILTDGYQGYPGIDRLAFAAAEIVPGLVPTRQEMQQEGQLTQALKEAREIDQGIFFWGILRNQKCGMHLIKSSLMPTERARELLPQLTQCGVCRVGAIDVERKGAAALVTINNGNALNSEDDALIGDMEVAVDLVLLDENISVGVLRGGFMNHHKYAGRRVFSSGINLKHLHAGRISFVNFLLRRELGYMNKILRGLTASGFTRLEADDFTGQKVWIAAVDSFAIGGGAQLLLVCDRVIAASDSYVSLPAANEGILPGVASLRLPRRVGASLARQMILFGRKIFANEPAATLLIDEVVSTSQMERAIDQAVTQLGNAAVTSNRRLLIFNEEPIDAFRLYMAEFAIEQSRRIYSEDVLGKVARFGAIHASA